MNMGRTPSRRRTWLFALACMGAFLFAGCAEKSTEAEDECKETAEPLIEPLFRIHIVAVKQSGGPYLGELTFAIEKHYCDGTTKGHFTDYIGSTPGGYWKPISTQYKLANTKDNVFAMFTAGPGQEASQVYYYEDVKENMQFIDFEYIFEDTLYLTVP